MAIYELSDIDLDAVSAGTNKPSKGVKVSRVNAGNVLVNANVSPAVSVGGHGFGNDSGAGTATSQSNNVSNDNL